MDSMTEKHLNIIAFDVPWPVDYGGVFDLFYKIKSLYSAGVRIHLHCFEYGRGQQEELNKYCASVHYYSRKSFWYSMTTGVPHIVASRANQDLLKNLKQNDYPVLMEGIHATYFLSTGDLPAHRCFVRLPNVEFKYYEKLAETSNKPAQKLYYQRESRLLKAYEASLANKATFWTINKADLEVFHDELGYQSVDYLPLYLPEFEPFFAEQTGTYCLYHGNLSVPENEHAAVWLLENIFQDLEIPFVIAGKNPSSTLEYLAHRKGHTCLVANPEERELTELIRKAQVHVLPSFNCTGVKLKLLHALFQGKHCIVNNSGVDGSDLNNLCVLANTTEQMKHAVQQCFDMPFTQLEFEERVDVLRQMYNNQRNAEQMINWIWNGEPTIPGKSIAWATTY